MKEKTTRRRNSSRVAWESLEKWARLEIQDWVRELMVAEVTELLGREKSERRKPVDTMVGYRNGYGKPWNLTMSVGTVTVRRPRVRDVEERFESRVLPLFKRRSETVSELIPELYLHGLAHGELRFGTARASRRERSAFSQHGVAAETEMAGRVRTVAGAPARRSRAGRHRVRSQPVPLAQKQLTFFVERKQAPSWRVTKAATRR